MSRAPRPEFRPCLQGRESEALGDQCRGHRQAARESQLLDENQRRQRETRSVPEQRLSGFQARHDDVAGAPECSFTYANDRAWQPLYGIAQPGIRIAERRYDGWPRGSGPEIVVQRRFAQGSFELQLIY
jgi:hypothetical protein